MANDIDVYTRHRRDPLTEHLVLLIIAVASAGALLLIILLATVFLGALGGIARPQAASLSGRRRRSQVRIRSDQAIIRSETPGVAASGRGAFVLLLVDRFAERSQVCVQGTEEAEEGVPADAAMPVLDLRDIGRADLHLPRQLLLGELGAFA